ncbi:MAG TPA: preprotein translocase subunit SecE [bacterium]|nr:preprotein translocase subunit SecE [bacterium]
MSYRKDDGRYARMLAFWALFLLFGYGCFHGDGLADRLNFWMEDSNTTYVDPFPILGTLKTSTVVALVVWLLTGLVLKVILNKPRVADTLIDTEAEMEKVTWPSWNETWHGTLAVAAMVAVLFAFLFVADLGLVKVMSMLMGRGGA